MCLRLPCRQSLLRWLLFRRRLRASNFQETSTLGNTRERTGLLEIREIPPFVSRENSRRWLLDKQRHAVEMRISVTTRGNIKNYFHFFPGLFTPPRYSSISCRMTPAFATIFPYRVSIVIALILYTYDPW